MGERGPRKTLDDIRRELEAEFAASTRDDRIGEPAAAPARESVSPEAERVRSASVPRGQRRRYVMAAALGCIAGQVLLLAVYAAATRNVSGTAAEHRGREAPAEPSAAILAPVSAPGIDQQLDALRAELQALTARLERSESRIVGVESRVTSVESAARRVGDGAAPPAVSRRAERAAPESRQRARKPPPAALQPAPAPAPATDSERWIPSEPAARGASLVPDEPRPLAAAAAPATPSAPPQPQIEPAQSLTSAATTDDGPSREARAPDNAPAASAPATVRDKVREEWRTIKQTLGAVSDDIKAGVRGLARKVRGE